MQQSKRLMFILTPPSGSELPDQHPAGPQYLDTEGFVWEVKFEKTFTVEFDVTYKTFIHCLTFVELVINCIC